jgi:hypothetical protein
MATKKKAAKGGTLPASLKFKKEWIFDPPPPFIRIDRIAQQRINQLKTDFVNKVNEVISKSQG